jgi:hypothetical protein
MVAAAEEADILRLELLLQVVMVPYRLHLCILTEHRLELVAAVEAVIPIPELVAMYMLVLEELLLRMEEVSTQLLIMVVAVEEVEVVMVSQEHMEMEEMVVLEELFCILIIKNMLFINIYGILLLIYIYFNMLYNCRFLLDYDKF